MGQFYPIKENVLMINAFCSAEFLDVVAPRKLLVNSVLVFFMLMHISAKAQLCHDVDSCWPSVITIESHIIIIISPPLVNGTALPAGSYIGVFFDAGGGNLICAGNQLWSGFATSLAAFGNDDTISPVGMAPGEKFKFKYLLPTGEIIDSVEATYVQPPGGGQGILTHTDSYASFGISQIDSMWGTTPVACDPADCDDQNACTLDSCDNGNCVNIDSLCAIGLNLRAFLGGPYDTGSQLMKDDLRLLSGEFPLEEPYSQIFTQHLPGGGEAIESSLLDISGDNAIVDWVFVELRDKNASSVVMATRSALIQRDGDVVDIDGGSTLLFSGVISDSYFVSIRHRNHLGVMTASAVSLGFTPVVIDFTSPATPTYGVNAQYVADGKQVMWSGNVINDKFIKYSGPSNDRDPILQEIGGVVPTAVTYGYAPEDVNMDGAVKYSGAANDRDPILVNIGGVVPTAFITEQLP